MKIRIATATTEDPTPKDLTPQQRKEWNSYVDWLAEKGMKGSPLLDKGDTGLRYFKQFLQENPSVSLRPEHIKAIQQEVEGIAQKTRDLESRKGNPNASNIMTGTSKFDGIPGSKTTSFKIPEMDVKTFHNNALVGVKNLGLVNSQLQPAAQQGGVALPKGAKPEPLYDSAGKITGYGYKDPLSGDIVRLR